MKRIFKNYFSLVIGICFLSHSVLTAAETGIVSGTVTGGDNGYPLPFVNVWIDGTTIGTATDLDGNYYLPGVPTGEQVIVFSYIGYEQTKKERFN